MPLRGPQEAPQRPPKGSQRPRTTSKKPSNTLLEASEKPLFLERICRPLMLAEGAQGGKFAT
eukprot:2430789-Pyramimonas_sp.AAC.1